MTPIPVRSIRRLVATLAAAMLLVGGVSIRVYAQSAPSAYQRAQARERTARAAAAPTAATLRGIATSYEVIVRKHPTSSYCDNALWQAAGLLQLAYERGNASRDRDAAVKLLRWLKREYPGSGYARQADDRIAALTAPRAPATAAATPKPPAPRAPASAAAVVPAPAPVPDPAPAPATPAKERPLATPTPGPTARPPAQAKPKGTTVASGAVEVAPAVKASPLAPLPVAFREYPVSLREASAAPLPRGERITIELTQEVAHTVQRVGPGDQMSLDLPGVGVAPPVVEAMSKLHGTLVRNVRVSPGPDGLIVKVDLAGRPRFSTFPLYDPYRIVIDLEPDEAAAAAAAPPPAPVPQVVLKPATRVAGGLPPVPPTSTGPSPAPVAAKTTSAESAPLPPSSTKGGNYSLARQLGLGVSRIVIDPGHGGHDPGAQSNGVSEAELTLDVARRLEALLHDQPGFEVVLTRKGNDYVGLQERTAIANRENADVFLSIHANSSPQREARGIETYVLNFASNPQAEAVAARENATSVQAMNVLPQLVKTIALNNKLTESRELAALVQGSLMRRLSVQNKAVKDLGVKQAPFVVLIGAQMPSVLAEVSFLTNKAEAGLVKQDAYRQRIAQALCDAVLKYQSSLKKLGTVALVEPR